MRKSAIVVNLVTDKTFKKLLKNYHTSLSLLDEVEERDVEWAIFNSISHKLKLNAHIIHMKEEKLNKTCKGYR